ncbi:hypothetical protein [Parashewanella tropica]|uniref:hypothetical protein n=1 Tax=Parashewanella tropica TaxID=2547970 RepID=UPI0010597589|nr:hypothetical protein [Parashewanella tropica]
MKSTIIALFLCTISCYCLSAIKVKFQVSYLKFENTFALSASGDTDVGMDLLESWKNKVNDICGSKKAVVIINNGNPIIRNTRDSDTYSKVNGQWVRNKDKASVYGIVRCSAT